MTTTYTLTGKLPDVIGNDSVSVSATLGTNLGDVALVDLDNNETRLPGLAAITLDANLAFTMPLIATNSTGTNVPDGSLRYIVRVEYRDGLGARRSWNSGYFALTANTDLSDVAGTDVVADVDPAIAMIGSLVDQAVEQAIEDHTPGIELGYAERTTTYAPTAGGTIPSLTVIVVGNGRPCDIEAQVTKGYHSASAPLTFALQSGAVSIATDEGTSYSTTTGKSFRAKRRMVLTDGVTYTFTILVAHGIGGTMTWFADANRPMFISVTSR